MELKDLVGEHILDAVDFCEEQVKNYYGDGFDNCSVIRFRLDGNVYIASEDPDDGYRSSMRDLVVGYFEMKNIFPPIKVVGVHRKKGDRREVDDILELIVLETGKVVIEVGTENLDDYYPSFVANFDPTAMQKE